MQPLCYLAECCSPTPPTSNATLLIALGALAVSVGTLATTVYFNFERRRLDAHFNNLSEMIKIEEKLKDLPSALRFHGITEAELSEAGITATEFSYLLTSFTAGGLYYKIERKGDETPFTPQSYRFPMCRSEATRRAWPLLARMMSDSTYKRKIRNTIFLEEYQANQSRSVI